MLGHGTQVRQRSIGEQTSGSLVDKEPKMIEQGTICVLRKAWIDGECEILVMPLADQLSYKEWTGCFSYIKPL
jgi:hypothetical protein